jgi:subtilisin-like proprotein convertase family protein
MLEALENRMLYATFNSGSAVNIPDLTTVSSPIQVSGLNGVVAKVTMTLNLQHTWDSDLAAYLVSPSGRRVDLFTNVGGSGDDFSNTRIEDAAG